MNFDYNTFLNKTLEEQLDILEWTIGLAEEFGIFKETILIKVIGNSKFPLSLMKHIFKEKKWECSPNMTGEVITISGFIIKVPIYCYSMICGYYERAKEIILEGADVNLKFHHLLMNIDVTPLEYLINQSFIISNDIVKNVELLIQSGANVNQVISSTNGNDNILTLVASIIKDEYELNHQVNEIIRNLVKLLKCLIINGANPSYLNDRHYSYFEIIPYEVRNTLNCKKISKIKYIKTKTCIICKDKPSTISVLPCGHLCMCVDCTLNDYNNLTSCPLCRGYVSEYQFTKYLEDHTNNNPPEVNSKDDVNLEL